MPEPKHEPEPTEPYLASLQIGSIRHHGQPGAADPFEREWTTAFFKEPVQGALPLLWLGLGGDEQADRRLHGGPDRAVLAYSLAHYDHWRQVLGRSDCGPGWFGENFTVAGLDEHDVAIGDRFALGSAEVEVSQPRPPCWKLARRWRIAALPKLATRENRTGWYLRVRMQGVVHAGMELTRTARPYPEWTIAKVNELTYAKEPAPPELSALSALSALIACEALSASWKRMLARRVPA